MKVIPFPKIGSIVDLQRPLPRTALEAREFVRQANDAARRDRERRDAAHAERQQQIAAAGARARDQKPARDRFGWRAAIAATTRPRIDRDGRSLLSV
jgi:hypothetical protein